MATKIFLVYEDHADYTTTEFGYFSSRENAVAFIERQGGRMKEAYEDEIVGIVMLTLDEPLRGYGFDGGIK